MSDAFVTFSVFITATPSDVCFYSKMKEQEELLFFTRATAEAQPGVDAVTAAV